MSQSWFFLYMSSDNLSSGGRPQGMNLMTLSYSELFFFLYMSTDNLRRRTPTRNEFNSTAIVHTAVRSLHFYSDRETTDSVLHLLVLKSS